MEAIELNSYFHRESNLDTIVKLYHNIEFHNDIFK